MRLSEQADMARRACHIRHDDRESNYDQAFNRRERTHTSAASLEGSDDDGPRMLSGGTAESSMACFSFVLTVQLKPILVPICDGR